jgi:hypothetical protein
MIAALAFAVSASFVPALATSPAIAQSTIQVTCAFANPAYAGECVERATRAEREKPAAACRPILDCLNNPQCVKNYCQATTIRQGWTLKKAE